MIRFMFVALLIAGCASAPPTSPSNPAPWQSETLARSAVPAVYVTEWQKAENRATCALIAPRSTGAAGANATPRRATFSGGWAVAYDLADTRSAFGVAGTGASKHGDTYQGWPHRMTWDDGSTVEYGPEGGEGPNQLAYLRIEGQDCLYNIWSRLGREHLEELIAQLRFVE